jgi:hypothetical protein
MPCTITISSPFSGVSPASGGTNVTISGTIVVAPGTACSDLQVSIACGATIAGSGSATIDNQGNWTITLPTKCNCGDTATVYASCPSLGCSASANGLIVCPPECCPKITTRADVGECDDVGRRQVCFPTTVDVPTGCNVTVQWDFGDGHTGSSHTFPAGSHTFTDCHWYASGTYTPHLNVVFPQGCLSSSVTVNVPPCDCCPKISKAVSVGECDSKGNRLVTFTITVNAKPPPCSEAQVHLDFGDNTTGAPHAFAPSSSGSYTETHTYSPGLHTAYVIVDFPPGCRSVSIPFIVLPCPDCCPDVSVIPCIEDCDKHGNRIVTFTITVTAKPPPCPPTQFEWDFGDGTPPSTYTIPPSGSYSSTVTHTYSGSSDHTASLNVIQPQGCPGWSNLIPKCCTKKRTKWCNKLFLTMTVSPALALVLLLLKSLCSVPVPTWVILALLGVFILALLVYLLLGCPKCRCGWLYLLLWRVLFGVGILFAIFSGCCSPWSFLIGLGLMIPGIVFLLLWKKKCCVKFCRFLTEIVVWVGGTLIFLVGVILGIVGNSCLLVLISTGWPIQLFTFYLLVLIIWAWLLCYYVNNCTEYDC